MATISSCLGTSDPIGQEPVTAKGGYGGQGRHNRRPQYQLLACECDQALQGLPYTSAM